MRQAGYATGGFVANVFWGGRHTGLARGFMHYEDFYGTLGDALQRMTLVRAFPGVLDRLGVNLKGRKPAAVISRDFLNWEDGLGDRPFFAFLNFMDVHAPYLPPPEYEGRFGPRLPDLRRPAREVAARGRSLPPPDELAYRIDRYDESLTYLDASIGAMLDELERRGRLATTVVIVTSDHGEHFGEHGLVEHGKSLYIQETRVPLIISLPGAHPGRRIARPVSTTRLAATIRDLAGLPASDLPGRSLFAPPGHAEYVLSEMGSTGGEDSPAGRGWLKSLVDGRWRYVRRESGRRELYDMATDLRDSINLAATPHGAVVAGRLEAVLGTVGRLPPAQ
jgi:arylsulfatase A-like enzyme